MPLKIISRAFLINAIVEDREFYLYPIGYQLI